MEALRGVAGAVVAAAEAGAEAETANEPLRFGKREGWLERRRAQLVALVVVALLVVNEAEEAARAGMRTQRWRGRGRSSGWTLDAGRWTLDGTRGRKSGGSRAELKWRGGGRWK